MKKNLLLVAVFTALGFSAFAQKPTEGNNMSLEVQLNIADPSATISEPSIRFRYFLQPTMAIRFGLAVDNTKTSDDVWSTPGQDTSRVGTYETGSMTWSVSPGFEYHFAGTDRLSPYAGLALSIGGGKSTVNATNATSSSSYQAGYTFESESPVSMFGWGVMGGVDFYFAENFFIGAEVGFSGMSYTTKEGTATTTFGGTTSTSKTEASKWSWMGTGSFNSGIRLGWRF